MKTSRSHRREGKLELSCAAMRARSPLIATKRRPTAGDEAKNCAACSSGCRQSGSTARSTCLGHSLVTSQNNKTRGRQTRRGTGSKPDWTGVAASPVLPSGRRALQNLWKMRSREGGGAECDLARSQRHTCRRQE
jgi:hypothetical protein